MADTITLSNGENITLFSDRDITDIIERFCGYDFAKYVGEIIESETTKQKQVEELEELLFDYKFETKMNDYYDELNNDYQEILDCEDIAKLKKIINQKVDTANAMYKCANGFYTDIERINNII